MSGDLSAMEHAMTLEVEMEIQEIIVNADLARAR